MDKIKLFPALEKLKKTELLDLVKSTYEHLSVELRESIFIKYMPTEYPSKLDSKEVIRDIERFQELSLAGHYYAPFDINSKGCCLYIM